MRVPSFNFVTLTVVEKSVTKIYLMRTDGMTDGRKEGMTEGQGKSSIALLFQSICRTTLQGFRKTLYFNLMSFNPFISQIIVEIYTVKSIDFSSVTNKKVPNGIIDGGFSTILEQGTYSGRNKIILLNASSTKFQHNPTQFLRCRKCEKTDWPGHKHYWWLLMWSLVSI